MNVVMRSSMQEDMHRCLSVSALVPVANFGKFDRLAAYHHRTDHEQPDIPAVSESWCDCIFNGSIVSDCNTAGRA